MNKIIHTNYPEISSRLITASFQRDINVAIVMNIVEHIKAYIQINKDPILSVIDLALYENQYYVVDGQHRLTALKYLFEEKTLIVEFYCMIYPVTTYDEMKDIFILRNSNIDVPEYLLVSPVSKQSLINQIKDYLVSLMSVDSKHIFRGKLEKTKKVNAPNVDIDKFMDFIVNSTFFLSIDTLEEFIRKFNILNNYVKQLSSKENFRKSNKISSIMIQKCYVELNEIFIGLLRNYDIFDDYPF